MAIPAASLIADLEVSIGHIRNHLKTKVLFKKPTTEAKRQEIDLTVDLMKDLSTFINTGLPSGYEAALDEGTIEGHNTDIANAETALENARADKAPDPIEDAKQTLNTERQQLIDYLVGQLTTL